MGADDSAMEPPVVLPPPPPPGSRALFVADAGGHLLEARVLQQLLYPQVEPIWYTADTLMSRTNLAGLDAVFAGRRVLPKRPDLAVAEHLTAHRLLRRIKPDLVISTGSAVALSWLTAAKMHGLRAIFHESSARFAGLSLTGRLLDRAPGIERYTQTPMRLPRWQRSRSSLEIAERVRSAAAAPSSRTVFVTVGTYEFPFPRLLSRVEAVVPADWQIVWQIGHSGGYRPTRGEVHEFIGYDETVRHMSEAQVIVTHAGIGSVLTALETGRLPVVVPRRVGHGEHTDDHQLEVIPTLRGYGIEALGDVAELSADHFR